MKNCPISFAWVFQEESADFFDNGCMETVMLRQDEDTGNLENSGMVVEYSSEWEEFDKKIKKPRKR